MPFTCAISMGQSKDTNKHYFKNLKWIILHVWDLLYPEHLIKSLYTHVSSSQTFATTWKI